MISFNEASEIILNSVKPIEDVEERGIVDSVGFVLAEDIISPEDVPGFDNSAMDGYAVRSDDVRGADAGRPVILRITGEVKAGGYGGAFLEEGCCIRIMTGAKIPDGADAVIPIEFTQEIDSKFVKIFRPVDRGDNIRCAGRDIKRGDIVLRRGRILSPPDIGVMASIGVARVKVFRKPKVSILTTGDEIIDIDEKLEEGKVRNSNVYMLCSYIKSLGLEYIQLGNVSDEPREIYEKVMEGLQISDILITSGGVSAGRYDYLKDVFQQAGIRIKFSKVKIKPGKPMVFGVKDGKLIFGLPGNPVSCAVGFLIFIKPAIFRMMNTWHREIILEAQLVESIKKRDDRLDFQRGIFSIRDGKIYVRLTGVQDSNILTSMSRANCLILFPEHRRNLRAGEKVKIILI